MGKTRKEKISPFDHLLLHVNDPRMIPKHPPIKKEQLVSRVRNLAEKKPDRAVAIGLRFGLDGRGPRSLKEIAARPDITATTEEGVRQIVKKTLHRLRYDKADGEE